MLFVLLLIFTLYLLLSKERYTSPDPFLDGIKDRFIDPQNHRYINQIDFYRDAPNIDLEREFRKSSCNITKDWDKMTDYEYSQAIQCIQGSEDRTKIKSINAS